jgi:rubredoxin
MSMPQRVSCQGCGHVLYEGPDLRPPDEILQEHEGKCPNCGKKLSFVPVDVNVIPIR